MIRSKKITEAARGEECTLEILGVCSFDPSTVVYCHFPDEEGGIALKSDDVSGAFGCHACHDAVDGRVQSPEFKQRSDWYMRRAQTRTVRRLIEKGVFKLK